MSKSYDIAVCNSVLAGLNQSHHVPEHFKMPKDYAMIELHYYLGSNQSVDWVPEKIPTLITQKHVVGAYVDLFNDGSILHLVRLQTTVDNSDHIKIYVDNPSLRATPSRFLRFHPELEKDGLMQFHADVGSVEMEFSLKNIIEVNGQNYVLLKTLRDIDLSGRVYLLKMYRFETYKPNGFNGYELKCVFELAS